MLSVTHQYFLIIWNFWLGCKWVRFHHIRSHTHTVADCTLVKSNLADPDCSAHCFQQQLKARLGKARAVQCLQCNFRFNPTTTLYLEIAHIYTVGDKLYIEIVELVVDLNLSVKSWGLVRAQTAQCTTCLQHLFCNAMQCNAMQCNAKLSFGFTPLISCMQHILTTLNFDFVVLVLQQ